MIDSAWKDWYRAQHDQRCNARGEAFETYVTNVLARLHSDYLNPAPMGTLGDGGCDGLANNGEILYACYGQRASTKLDQKTKEKLESDFARALFSWSSFTTWRFVTNASVGPMPINSLLTLQNRHGPKSSRPLTLEIWKAPEDFWWKAVNKLNRDQLDEVIPGVPHALNVELDDLVDLIESLEVADETPQEQLKTIASVPPSKMDYNGLPKTTRAEFNEGRLLSRRIDEWFNRHADPTLRDMKARSFRCIYEEAKKSSTDVREIVRRIYGALGGQDFDMSTKRANAVYAVTAYFFDSCDIFEKPPSEYVGTEDNSVSSN